LIFLYKSQVSNINMLVDYLPPLTTTIKLMKK